MHKRGLVANRVHSLRHFISNAFLVIKGSAADFDGRFFFARTSLISKIAKKSRISKRRERRERERGRERGGFCKPLPHDAL